MQIIPAAACDFSSRRCVGVLRQPFIMESSPSCTGIFATVGAAAVSLPSTPAWRVVPALERHHRCGGQASVALRCGRCCRFGSRTSTRSVGLAAGRLSVFAAPSLSVGSRARWCCGVTLRRRRRRPAAVLDGAARCCRRWPMPHHQLGASIINVLAYSTTTTWMRDGLDERQWTCARTNL